MAEILFKEESFAIIGACFEVYNDKGGGFHEGVYHECLEIELRMRGVLCFSKPMVQLTYKGRMLDKVYEPDLVCFGKIIVELKALDVLVEEHRSQVHNYLKATGFRLGLLVNFAPSGKLHHERVIR